MRTSTRRLRLATLLAPAALVLVVVGPALTVLPGPRALGQTAFAALGAVAAVGAVYHADACDDLPSIGEQNLRLLMLMVGLISIAIAGAWLWLGAMNLTSWLLGSGGSAL